MQLKLIPFALFSLLFFAHCHQKPLAKAETNAVSVIFNVITPKITDKTAKVTLAGSHVALGEWQPDRVALTQKNDTLWTTTVKLPRKYAAEFKITRGSWATEAVTKTGVGLQNHKFLAYKDTVLTIKVENWKDVIFTTNPILDGVKRQVTGNVETIKNMEGLGIKPRNVHIWLPPNYETDKNARFPVVYMHDGQNCFDPKTATGGIDWALDETADSLIRNGIVQPFIMVAMDCTADRYEEYGYGDLGKKYRIFIKNQVKKMIDKRFRTKTDAANTIGWGSSMGGLCAFEMLFEDPETFGGAACFSPAFKVVNHTRLKLDYVKIVQSRPSFNFPHLIYIDNGTQDLEAVLQPGIDDMMGVLKQKNIQYTWFLDEGATHNEAAWSKRAWRPFVQFFGRK
jgi:predicted alpha/beta superfamily hydrolase